MRQMQNCLLLVALAFCWGPSFLLIKLSLEGFSPFSLVWLRVTIGALFLFVWMKIKRHQVRNYLTFWREYILIGLFANGLPFILITFAQQYIPSNLSAILNSTTPLFTLLLAHFTIQEEPLSWNKVAGVCLGLIGIALLFAPSLVMTKNFNILSSLAVLLASLSYGIGMVLSKHFSLKHGARLTKGVAFFQLLFASIMVFPFCLIAEGTHVSGHIPIVSIVSLLALALLGTSLAFILYHKLLQRAGASILSYATLLFPLIGIFLGHVILQEPLNSLTLLAAVVIFSGLIVANFGKSIKKKFSSRQSTLFWEVENE